MYQTEYYLKLKENLEKLKIFEEGLKNNLITPFDQSLLSKLRRIYYATYNGVLYLYGFKTNDATLGNKMEILTYALKDKDYTLVDGDIDYLKDEEKEQRISITSPSTTLEYNSWVEVKEGNHTYIYDVISMFKYEKEIYEKLEHPKIIRTFDGEEINRKRVESFEEYEAPTLLSVLTSDMDVPVMHFSNFVEEHFLSGPFKDFLRGELAKYKDTINYDERVREMEMDMYMRKRH